MFGTFVASMEYFAAFFVYASRASQGYFSLNKSGSRQVRRAIRITKKKNEERRTRANRFDKLKLFTYNSMSHRRE